MLEDINKKLEKMNVDARSNAGLPSSEEKDEGEEEEGEIDVGGVVSGDEDVVNGRSVLRLLNLILVFRYAFYNNCIYSINNVIT